MSAWKKKVHMFRVLETVPQWIYQYAEVLG